MSMYCPMCRKSFNTSAALCPQCGGFLEASGGSDPYGSSGSSGSSGTSGDPYGGYGSYTGTSGSGSSDPYGGYTGTSGDPYGGYTGYSYGTATDTNGNTPAPYGQGGAPAPYGQQSGTPSPYGQQGGFDLYDDKETTSRTVTPAAAAAHSKRGSSIYVEGMIQSHRQAMHHRFFLQKLIDAIAYGQNFSDTCQQFMVSDKNGTTYSVTAYGDVTGGGAMIPDQGQISVSGKLNGSNVIMATGISVGGAPVQLRNQGEYGQYGARGESGRPDFFGGGRRGGGLLGGALPISAIIVILCVLGIIFVPQVRTFFITWLVVTVVMAAIASSFKALQWLVKMPIVMAVIGFLFTLMIYGII